MPASMTEDQLIEAMRDPRYWQQNHPERLEHIDRVTKGWEDLYRGKQEGKVGGNTVHVKEHTRHLSGGIIHVKAYNRRNAESGSQDQIPNLEKEREYDVAISRREMICKRQHDADALICNSLPSPKVRAVCWYTANERNGQCLAGRPIQNLFTGW